jgi:tRNA synthetases class I (I, L, M and V)
MSGHAGTELPKNFDPAASEERMYSWCASLAARQGRALCTQRHSVKWHAWTASAAAGQQGCLVTNNMMRHCRWEEQGFFRPDEAASGEPFTVPMPPPNVTGRLHMGHAMFVTLQASCSSEAVLIDTGCSTTLRGCVPLGKRCQPMPAGPLPHRTSWPALRACGGAPPCGSRALTTQASPHR